MPGEREKEREQLTNKSRPRKCHSRMQKRGRASAGEILRERKNEVRDERKRVASVTLTLRIEK